MEAETILSIQASEYAFLLERFMEEILLNIKLCQMFEKDETNLEWVKKDYQLANALTKKEASCELLIEVLK